MERAREDAPRIRLKDIARELGLSIATIERALKGKPDIHAATRARVQAFAEQVGYTPNLAARVLQSRRPLRFSIQLPGGRGPFWDTLREGILRAAAACAPGVQLEFLTYSSQGDEIQLLERALARGTDGLIVAPGDTDAVACHLERAARNIPMVCVGTGAPVSPRLVSVSTDAFALGAVGGELLARFLPGGGEVGVFTDPQTRRDHAEALRGFLTYISTVNPAVRLGTLVEAPRDEAAAQRLTVEALRARPTLKGLYISTSNALSVLRAADRECRLAGLPAIVTEMSAELADLIRAGTLAAAIDPRPLAQGHLALRSLYELLQTPQRRPATYRIGPGVVMRSNLDLWLEGRSTGQGSLSA